MTKKPSKYKAPEYQPDNTPAPTTAMTFEDITAKINDTYAGHRADLEQAKIILKSGTEKMISLGNLLIEAEPLYKAKGLTLDEFIEKHVPKLAVSTAHMAKRIARRLERMPDKREYVIGLPILAADKLLARAYRELNEVLEDRQSTARDNYKDLNMGLRNALGETADVLKRIKEHLGEDGWRAFLATLPKTCSESLYLLRDGLRPRQGACPRQAVNPCGRRRRDGRRGRHYRRSQERRKSGG